LPCEPLQTTDEKFCRSRRDADNQMHSHGQSREAPSLFLPYDGDQGSASNTYASVIRFTVSTTKGDVTMLDIVYLALGVGLFGLMGLYARWASNA
jgi:hypothetical protein